MKKQLTVETAAGPIAVDLAKLEIDPSVHPGGIKTRVCQVSMNGSKLDYTNGIDKTNKLDVLIYSTGETVVGIAEDGKRSAIVLTNRAAHELRDFLNRRFPNATAVQ
jgi:hypothetical protein